MAGPIRILPLEAADGPTNMARDESLLLTAEEGFATLRFYTWSVPTLSLGYFQPGDIHRSDPNLATVAMVRRPSGGAAIMHHHELTYSLTLPNEGGWNPMSSWICKVHHIIIDALATFGISARAVTCEEEKKLGEVLCFLHQTPGDLLIDEHKVVGSAQRRRRWRLMQHGSILLHRSPHAPALPGICDLTGKNITCEELREAILKQFTATTYAHPVNAEWSHQEMIDTEMLKLEKYQNPEWNHKW